MGPNKPSDPHPEEPGFDNYDDNDDHEPANNPEGLEWDTIEDVDLADDDLRDVTPSTN